MGDAVTICGKRKAEPDVPADAYHRRERPLGASTRSVSVGDRLNPDLAQATYTNGILRVRLILREDRSAASVARLGPGRGARRIPIKT